MKVFQNTWDALEKVDKSDVKGYVISLLSIALETAIAAGEAEGKVTEYIEEADKMWMKLLAVSQPPPAKKVTIPA